MEETTKNNSEITWDITDEPVFKPTQEKEIGVFVIAVLLGLWAVFVSAYTAIPIIVIAAVMFIYVSRREKKIMTFRLTEKYLYAPNEKIEMSTIGGYNIVSDPKEKDHLCLHVGGIVGTIVIPVFDIDVEKIKNILKKSGAKEDKNLSYSFIDSLTAIL